MSGEGRGARTLAVAADVSAVLSGEGVSHALIGSVALAAHGYVRATRDLDLAVLVAPVPRLTALRDVLAARGYAVELSTPAPDDELGGVLTVAGDDFDPVQLVNFYNPPRPPPALVREAIDAARPHAGVAIPVVDVPHLVALKLATAAFRDEVDVGDLLEARPELPLDPVRDVCRRHGLEDAFARVLGRVRR